MKAYSVNYLQSTITRLSLAFSMATLYGVAMLLLSPYSLWVFFAMLCTSLTINPSHCILLHLLTESSLRFERALRHQPTSTLFLHPYIAYALIAAGNTLVLTSYYALGITGTFLGDYFGILMDEPVTGFPFNITSAPMYWGSTMSFLGTALLYGRPAGVLLTAEVLFVYSVALQWEDPFTSKIYKKRDEEREKGKKAQ